MIRQAKLHNGIRVIMEPMDHLRSVSIGVWVNAGSVYESGADAGISHFIEHMVFKGTARRSAADIAAAQVRPINLHGLRHSMATLAVSLGVNMRVLQQLLGHSSYAVTAGTYAHVLHADQAAAMDKITCAVL